MSAVRFCWIFAEAEVVALVILFLVVLYDLTFFLGVTLRRPSVELTESQKKMLGVNNSGVGKSLSVVVQLSLVIFASVLHQNSERRRLLYPLVYPCPRLHPADLYPQ